MKKGKTLKLIVRTKEEQEAIIAEEWVYTRIAFHDHRAINILPYVIGVDDQLVRYRNAYDDMIGGKKALGQTEILRCTHEFSTLVTDLYNIKEFMNGIGHHHPIDDLIDHVRQHLSHDLIDFKPAKNWKVKNKVRTRFLKRPADFNPTTGTRIEPRATSVRVMKRVIYLQDVRKYIEWVGDTMAQDLPRDFPLEKTA